MRKKKIGLVAVTNHNYGSILQTYALQSAVMNLGCDTQIIGYAEGKVAKIGRFRNMDYAVSRIKIILKQLSMNILLPRQKHLLGERSAAFSEFINNELSLTDTYCSLDKLTEISSIYDIILLGSDQVWHPLNYLMNFFTLNFVPNSVKKGAYAPSFGVSNIPTAYKRPYSEYISRIEYVSCREMAGVKLIKELTGRDVPMVCDPTLLLTAKDWEKCLSDKVKIAERYVFCYFIGNNPKQREVVKQYAKKYNLKVVALLHIDE